MGHSIQVQVRIVQLFCFCLSQFDEWFHQQQQHFGLKPKDFSILFQIQNEEIEILHKELFLYFRYENWVNLT